MHPLDPFSAVEADVRALVANPRWAGLPDHLRAEALATTTVVTPDGGRWLFGAHARWYLHDPADGRWHLAAPPRGLPVRAGRHGSPVLNPVLLPTGADFIGPDGSTQAFIGPDVHPGLTEEVRVLLRRAGRKSELDYPLTSFRDVFAADVPSTVAAVWGTIMWCAYAPAFDGNERLLTIFGEYLRRPLPGDEWVRWLTRPSLEALVTLYAERVRATGRSDPPLSAPYPWHTGPGHSTSGHHSAYGTTEHSHGGGAGPTGGARNAKDTPEKAGLRLVALMADTAQILADDPRFAPRAHALLAMLKPLLHQPALDHAAALRGDDTVRRAWLARVPADLARWILPDTDPGTAFRHTVYDLVESLAFTSDAPRAAASFLTDLPGAGDRLHNWLDHRVRNAYAELTAHVAEYGEHTEPDGFAVPAFLWTGATGGWPERATSPATARGVLVAPPDRGSAAAVLGAAYATGLTWCRLTGARLPEEGLAGARAIVRRLVHERDDIHP
ncbi:hypothetical protein [Nonomuraea endophytica]|uniref:Uncharacterized protein n=1 Tax=Nonomuraea endophytica TaxID=714136 RepID=A0A7W8EJ61_9ACTN|nr:hypothetical protein [Nonomuraea endophytica]MBB5082795.1 hypothetical protein [Nonomuraea endophytica]